MGFRPFRKNPYSDPTQLPGTYSLLLQRRGKEGEENTSEVSVNANYSGTSQTQSFSNFMPLVNINTLDP